MLDRDPSVEVVGVAGDDDTCGGGRRDTDGDDDCARHAGTRRAADVHGRPALVNSPTLLLADEPTAALDSAGGLEVLELFRRLHDGGQTVIMVTHSAEVASGADRRVLLRNGQVEESADS